MKIFKITLLVVALALVGSGTFGADAKVRKRRTAPKTEKKMKSCNKTSTKADQVKNCGLDMVEYNYQGMMMSPFAHIRLERKGERVVMVIRGTSGGEKEYVLNDGERLLSEALEIIEQEKMLDYASDYQIDPEYDLLDGYFWSFSARLADGRSVSSSGRNADPDGNGLSRIGKLLRDRAMKFVRLD